MKTYEGKYDKLFHLDLYRLTKTGMDFDLEDYYINKTKRLIESIPKETKIVLMSHTPFKEYSVSDNKNIGVPSNWIFKDYPNVKVYIHGHGHSKYKEEVIEGVLCITNPIVMNTSYLEKSYSLNEWYDMLKRY